MRIARLAFAMLVSAGLASEVNAAESPGSGGLSPSADMATKTAAHADDRQTIQLDLAKGRRSTAREAKVGVARRANSVEPQRGAGQLARASSDRQRSPLSMQARTRLAHQPSRSPVGSTHAATGGDGVIRGTAGARPVREPTRAASSIAARATTSLRAAAIKSTIGSPHAPGPALLGGPPIGRTTHNGTIDGTQLHHKF